MKSKLLLGIGIAAGYVLGSRSGRAAYDKLKARAASIWDSKPVQDKVSAATEAIKEKAPDVADQLGEAARRAGTVISSAVHHDAASGNSKSGNSKSKTSDAGASVGASGTAAGGSAAAATAAAGDHVPAHSTHPETVNLGHRTLIRTPPLMTPRARTGPAKAAPLLPAQPRTLTPGGGDPGSLPGRYAGLAA